MAYGALLLLMLIAGLNYANSLALLVTFLLAGLALVAMHACHRNLLGLTVAELTSRDSFAGTRALLQVRLQNSAAQPRIGIELDGTGQPAVDLLVAGERRYRRAGCASHAARAAAARGSLADR